VSQSRILKPLLLLCLIGAAVAIAACGDSDSSDSTSADSSTSSTSLADCTPDTLDTLSSRVRYPSSLSRHSAPTWNSIAR